VCWSCAKPRGDEDFNGRPAASESVAPSICTAPVESIVPRDNNPYRPVLIGKESANAARQLPPEAVEETTSQARRALFASIAGAIIFPPLTSLYSVYLLLQLMRHDTLSNPVVRNQVFAAWAINAVMIPTWILMWCFMLQ
jgi:hypothetical protein